LDIEQTVIVKAVLNAFEAK